MGAQQFFVVAEGRTAKEAFRRAVEEAQYEQGHGGYSGTIAEKNSFTLLPLAPGADPVEAATALLDADDPRVSDKWGPAGCFKLSDGRYYFFGWASS